MSQIVVPAVITPIGENEASTLLVQELTRKLGKPPPREMATLLFALIWTETGRGKPTCFNYGNITAYGNWPTIWRPPWYDLEQVQALPDTPKRQQLLGLHAAMLAGKAPSAFRAYDDSLSGMRDTVDRLFADFPEVVAASETGDAHAFVSAIKQKYSKDYGDAHVATFQSFQKGFGERQLFAALPKADGSVAPDSPGRSQPVSPVSWPSVLERVRDVPIIRFGSSTFLVTVWCRLLNIAMGTELLLSAQFDHGVEDATRIFQKEHGLKVDGIVGPLTWAKMFEVDMVTKS